MVKKTTILAIIEKCDELNNIALQEKTVDAVNNFIYKVSVLIKGCEQYNYKTDAFANNLKIYAKNVDNMDYQMAVESLNYIKNNI